MTASRVFNLPDVGEGLSEGEIVAWHVSEGSSVRLNDVLVEIETAKAVVELPSPFEGVVEEICAQVGEVLAVGSPLVRIGGGLSEPLQAAVAEASIPHDERPEREPVLVGYGPTHGVAARRPRRLETASALTTLTNVTAPDGEARGRAKAAPPLRKLARDMGVDLAAVLATGPEGRVTRSDVLAHTASLEQVDTAAVTVMRPTAGLVAKRLPIKGVRKATAAAMVASAFTAPHVTEWVEVDVTRTVKLIEAAKRMKALEGRRLTPLVFTMKAAVMAIGANPAINARWDDDAGEILQFADINLGVAAATPRGLIVPNIAGAQHMSVATLADELAALVAEARAGKTPPDRMRGGTFTITNIGTFGVDGGTPILNRGEAAILCVGRVIGKPWAHKGKVRLRQVATLSLSFDHRLVDGDLGSNVLRDIADLLEHPERAFLL